MMVFQIVWAEIDDLTVVILVVVDVRSEGDFSILIVILIFIAFLLNVDGRRIVHL